MKKFDKLYHRLMTEADDIDVSKLSTKPGWRHSSSYVDNDPDKEEEIAQNDKILRDGVKPIYDTLFGMHLVVMDASIASEKSAYHLQKSFEHFEAFMESIGM